MPQPQAQSLHKSDAPCAPWTTQWPRALSSEAQPACPRQMVPKATLVDNPSSILQEVTGKGPRGGGETLLSGKGVQLLAAHSAFLSPTGSPLPIILYLQPLQGLPGLLSPGLRAPCARSRVTSGRSKMRLCFCAGLSRLPPASHPTQ